MRQFFPAIAGALALAFLQSTPVEAASAVAISDLNLRAGPGISHRSIAVIPPGAPVEVGTCESNWCQVTYAGTTGFSSGRYLDFTTLAIVPRYDGYGRTMTVTPWPYRRYGGVPVFGRLFGGYGGVYDRGWGYRPDLYAGRYGRHYYEYYGR